MAHGESGATRPRTRGKLRKLALALIVLVVILGGVIALAGPQIASSVGRGIAEQAISKQIAGRAEIQTLKLSWSGPQRIERVTLYDPSGVEVAQVNGEVQGGLLALARNPRSIRKVTLTGAANIVEDAPGHTNLAAAIERPQSTVHVDATKRRPAKAAQTSKSANPLEGLDVEVEISSFDVSYASRGQTVKLDGLALKALIKPGAPITVDLSCVNAGTLADGSPGQLTGSISIEDVLAASGGLSPDKAKGQASITAALPGQWAAMVLSTLGMQTELPAGDANLDIHLQVADGRVRAMPDAPSAASAPAPADLVLSAAGASRIESLTTDGPLALRISKLDLPLAGVLGGAQADWRDAQLELSFTLPAIEARALGLPGAAAGEAARIALPASSITITTPRAEQGVMVNGALTATVNGESIGDVRLAAMLRNIITSEGQLARDMSKAQMEGALRIDDLPPSFAQRFAQGQNIDIEQLTGGPIDLVVEAKADADLGAGGTVVAFDLQSALTKAHADVIWRGDRLEAQRNGVHIESSAGAYLRSLAKLDASLHAEGPELVVITVPQAMIPWTKPRGVVWSEMRGQVSVDLQSLTVRPVGEGPLSIARVSTLLTKDANEPVIAVRAEGADDRSFFKTSAVITAIGGTALLKAMEDKGSLDLSTLAYEGTMSFDGLPVRAVSLVDPQRSTELVAAVGPTVSGEFTIEPVQGAQGGRSTHIYGMAQGANVSLFGGVLASPDQIDASTGQPISITLRQPIETARALGVDPATVLGEQVSIAGLDAATIDVRTLHVPLKAPKEALARGIDASMQLTALQLLAGAPTTNRTACDFDTVTANLQSTADAEAPLRVEVHAQNRSAARGSVDLDATVAHWAALATGSKDGTQQALVDATVTGDVPVALVDAFAGANGLLVAMIGDRAVTDVRATGLAIDRSAGTLTAALKASRADAQVFGRFEGGALVLTEQGTALTQASLTRIEPTLSQRLLEPIFPLFTSFQRADTERPTMISTRRLSIPTDGDFSKLNGAMSIDLGSMQFAAAPLLAAVLDATSNNTEGALLANVKPIEVVFQQGVATYNDFTIPWGRFNLQSRGKIDLVKKKMDVVALVPIAGLGGDVKRAVQSYPGLDKLALIPLRAKGELGKAKLQLDPDLINEALPSLIEDSVGGLLNDLLNRDTQDKSGQSTSGDKKKNKKKDKQQDEPAPTPSAEAPAPAPAADEPQESPQPASEPKEEEQPPSRWGSPRPR